MHIEFVAAVARLYCECFSLPFENQDLNHVKHIAGHMIPSIITSTAVASGLNCLQLYSVACRRLKSDTVSSARM